MSFGYQTNMKARTTRLLSKIFRRLLQGVGKQPLGAQKVNFDSRVHGDQYNEEDKARFCTPLNRAVPCSKPHQPCQGPYSMKKRLPDVTYRVQVSTVVARRGQKRVIDHFNRTLPGAPGSTQRKRRSVERILVYFWLIKWQMIFLWLYLLNYYCCV